MYSARIILDNYNPITKSRCTTFEFTMPKWLVAEFNTHRMIAKNSASSRAIPTHKLIEVVENNPVKPIDFREKNTGMVAETIVNASDIQYLYDEWIAASKDALKHVKNMLAIGNGVDKQRVNRLLEPFMWTTVVATATEWDNFFMLRNNSAAQPEFGLIAAIAQQLYDTNYPEEIQPNNWHLPYISPDEYRELTLEQDIPAFVVAFASTARIARVTYVNQDKKYGFFEEVERGIKLAKDRHMSPLDQVAMATYSREFFGHSHSFRPLRKYLIGESGSSKHGNWYNTGINTFIHNGLDFYMKDGVFQYHD